MFGLARPWRTFAASTVKRKRRDLDNRIADIVRTHTNCEETGAVLRKIANARDQLFTFVDAPGLVEPTNNACERALRPAVIARKVTNGFRAKWAAGGRCSSANRRRYRPSCRINPYIEIRQTITAPS